jgi:fructokinase
MSSDAEGCALVAGVELGGTKCIAVLARGRQILEREVFPTDAPGATIDRLIGQIAAWQDGGAAIASIGIGSFGPIGLDPVREDFGHITTTPKPGWADVDLRGAFARAFSLPIGFDTDVNGAALAEGRWGAARGVKAHVYLTIGTGIGGGLVIDGKPVHGMLHPEIGHIRVRRDAGFPGICPFHGDCLEGIVSGPAIAARTGLPAENLPEDHPVWREAAGELAELMAILILAVSPERILIGGGVGVGRQVMMPEIRRATARILNGYVAGLSEETLASIIRLPALGADAGPLGAVALALDTISGP